LAALKQIRARRPDGQAIYVILDNLSAHKGEKIHAGCASHAVERCFTPTYSSWANPIECPFGPLREFVLNNSDHSSHLVVAKKIHAYLRWRNDHAKHPDVLAAQRTERARIRSERQRRWDRPVARAA
jgi:transposase